MLILKAAALAIVVCVLVLCLKKDQPGFAFLLSLCGAAGLRSKRLCASSIRNT